MSATGKSEGLLKGLIVKYAVEIKLTALKSIAVAEHDMGFGVNILFATFYEYIIFWDGSITRMM